MENCLCRTALFVSLPPAGSTLLQMSVTEPKVAWSNSHLTTWLPPPVLLNGYLYGSHIPPEYFASTWDWIKESVLPFRCIDWKTGKVIWEKVMNYVTVTAAGGKLLMLELDGTLHVAEATPESYKELASTKVLADSNGPRIYATPPVLCGGRIYCRNFAGDLVCIDVRE